MTTNIEHNLHLATSPANVDRINSEFYGKFSYPPHAAILPSFKDRAFWIRMLNQDLGDWTNRRIPHDPKIWVAGCGTNQAVLTALRFPGASVTGTDISTESLRTCQSTVDAIGLENVNLSEQSLNQAIFEGEFDYVICTGVVHHNAQPEIPVQTLSKALKRNGVLELMVYNYYHRLPTTAFQKTIRALCNHADTIDTDVELPIAKSMIKRLPRRYQIGQFLSTFEGKHDAYVADALLQPVEHSYTVESLDDLLESHNLEILYPCINQFDRQKGRISWNVDFGDQDLQSVYNDLPDVRRWQIGNLVMLRDSPLLWFYVQRQDSDIPRKSQKEICDEFLETAFRQDTTEWQNIIRNPDGSYVVAPNVMTCPAPPSPTDPTLKEVFDGVVSGAPMKDVLRTTQVDTSFDSVNNVRVGLATSAFPYLRALP